ncbi:GNAT family N-acetyltransferase [uncultured Bacteroides sp.]|uniref:GNAT family N-acetyltransferase n=1 Tax=uncultured Bacteroides sp. TaxID=162156 RepID=UPI0025973D6A|nr:GNAT family N-acetyltransferase [uncultured Bacteroides sp.]
MEEYEVIHRPERNRFELEKNGMTAFVEYEVEDGALDIMHTIVPPPLEGKGIAAALVEATYKYASAQGLKPRATCSYAVAWLKRHPAE